MTTAAKQPHIWQCLTLYLFLQIQIVLFSLFSLRKNTLGDRKSRENINLLRKGTLDKAPFLIISNVIWVLSSDTDPGVELRIWLKQGKEKVCWQGF